MAESIEAFGVTFQAMDSKDLLLVMGGTWPAIGETAEIHVGLRYLIPVFSLIRGLGEYPMHDNPLWKPEDSDSVVVPFTREDVRIGRDNTGSDYEPEVGYGKRAGRIGDFVVDIWTAGSFSDTVFHIGKS